MSTKIQVSNHDFKLRQCLDYAHHSWKLHRNPKTKELQPIANFFRGRCMRLRSLMQLPAQVGSATLTVRDAFTRSVFEVTGKPEAENLSKDQLQQIEVRSNELLAQRGEELMRRQKQGPPEVWDAYVHQQIIDGLVTVELMSGNVLSVNAFQASMMSYVTTGWTIIETMAGDLWEAALNAHPSSLANLTGAPKRLKGGQINKSAPQTAKESKSIQLDDISRYGFNVADKMGTILRSKFEFASLDGIREAYACAFDKRSTQIDTALNDKSLDALSAVRNVIVHRDAQADAEYVRKAKFLSSIPKAEIGQHILLDGEIIVGLLKPAISAANRLFIAVDEWLAKPAQA